MKCIQHIGAQCCPRLLLAVLLFSVTLFLVVPVGAKQKPKLKLKKVYEYHIPKDLEGPGDFTLDPSGHYLYLIGPAQISVLDWRSGKKVAREKFQASSCPSKDELRLKDFQFIAGTPWAAMSFCEALYVIDRHTLQTIEKLSVEPPEVNDQLQLAVAPSGEYIAITLRISTLGGQNDKWVFSVFGHEETKWQRLMQWETHERIQRILFTPDSRKLAAMTFRNDFSYDVQADVCGTLVYEVPNGNLLGHYNTSSRDICRLEQSFVFLPEDPPVLVSFGDSLRDYEAAIVFRRFPSRERIGHIDVPGTFLNYPPSLSADGKLLTMETCGVPPEQSWLTPCSVFTIWDAGSREVLYQTPKWLSWPTRWARPRFGDDGRHLLVHKPGRIEIYEVTRLEAGVRQ